MAVLIDDFVEPEDNRLKKNCPRNQTNKTTGNPISQKTPAAF
jgi:hypothetical protein